MLYRVIISLCMAVFLAVPPLARCAEDEPKPWIDSVLIKRSQGMLVVDFRVNGVDHPRLAETLDSGLPLRFIYMARVERTSALLMGAEVAYTEFERVLEKDNLKNDYTVTIDQRQYYYGDLNEAMTRLTSIEGLELMPLSELQPSESYRLEIKVKLEEFRLPFLLHRILPFASYWDVTTPVYTQTLPMEQPATP